MANIVVTSNTTFVKADFGVYAVSDLPSPQVFNKCNIENVSPHGDGVVVYVGGVREVYTWYLSHTSIPDSGNVSYMVVDSVNGNAPSSRDDLINELYGM